MKPIIRLFTLVVLTLVLTFPAYTQKLDAIDQGAGTYTFTIELPKLEAKTKEVPTKPFYKHTILFGDGTFLFFDSDEKGSTSHTYGPPLSTSIFGYSARAYSAGAYGGAGDDIPDMIVGPITPPITGVFPSMGMVDSNRYIKVMRYVEVKPGDNFITVLSVKNPDSTTFRGQLFFFYNGRLNAVKKNEKEALPDYSIFNISEKMFYRPDVGSLTTLAYNTVAPSVQAKYEKMLMMEIFSLAPGEEVHYFMEMEGDPSMMDLFDATVKAEMDFGLALGSFSDNVSVLVPDSLEGELNSLKINSYISSLGNGTSSELGIQPDEAFTYSMDIDTTLEAVEFRIPEAYASIIVDYYTSTASLVKAHDPNYMRMESCSCSGEADLYQVFTTIHCENNGFGETSNIYMDVKLPEGIKATDVAIVPIRYHPFVGPADKISMEILSEDSIRWKLENFGIEGTAIHGVGDRRTYAEVQFNMYSHKDPALLDSVYACIRFDDLSTDPVCTIPVGVSFVDAELENGVLSCAEGECFDYPIPPFCLPWWAWLLLILLAILILILYLRRNA